MLGHTIIKGRSINDAWFKALKATMEVGTDYRIDQGEYEGQYRRELDIVSIHIEEPSERPLACQMQNILATTDDRIQSYFHRYLLDPDFTGEGDEALKEYALNEYKYSTWLGPCWQRCCDLLMIGEGGCNQATISVGSAMKPNADGAFYSETENKVQFVGEVIQYDKPPCLRVLDMRIKDGALHFIVYFRSWDLVGGFPENIGGFQLLKEFCLEYMEMKGRKYQDGSIVGISKGLHVYDHYWDTISNYVGNEDVAQIEVGDFGIWTI